jgi:hypothetical protein
MLQYSRRFSKVELPCEVDNRLNPRGKLGSQRLFPTTAEENNAVASLAQGVSHRAEVVRSPPFLGTSAPGMESNPGEGLGKELACALTGVVGNGIDGAQGALGDILPERSQKVEIEFNAVTPFGSRAEVVEDAGSVWLGALRGCVFEPQPRTADGGKERVTQSVAGLCAEEDVCSETPAAPESEQQGGNPGWVFVVAYQLEPGESPENRC